jgi:hypothetical protein
MPGENEEIEMLYELKEAASAGSVYYVNPKAVTSIVCSSDQKEGAVYVTITAGGVSLRPMYVTDQDFKAFLAEVQKTA